jgi:Cu2+-exporting ATPase
MARLPGDEMTLQALLDDGPAERTRSSATNELALASRRVASGATETELSVPDMHCASCIRRVETALRAVPGVEQARVNLSTRRVSVRWRGEHAPPLLETLDAAGFPAHLFEREPEGQASGRDPELGRLLRALAVAGFASMNVMLLSVSVWSGADAETRQIFHWISAALTVPCVAYAGRIFFVPAWRALRRGRASMDLPISIGVLAAVGLSLYDTLHDGPYAYFDAAISLIFVLLIGRTLDHVMREKARSAVRGLEQLSPRGAHVLDATGASRYVALAEIAPGMRVLVAAGELVPVDGRIESGSSEIDCSIATGESAPLRVAAGAAVQAGTLNLTGPLTLVASAGAQDSFLAELVRLMVAAEGGRAGYRRIADRAARLYAPAVHVTACASFLYWLLASGDWHRAITIAVAVLIITCPCALGLAVPMVHVVAARRLFERGIMARDGSAIERLAEIDSVAFDKTGTLTTGIRLTADSERLDPDVLSIAAALGSRSNHPHARALAGRGAAGACPVAQDVVEEPGQGIEGRIDGKRYRLGRADWAVAPNPAGDLAGTVLACEGTALASFRFEEDMRAGSVEAAKALRVAGLDLAILSGDRPAAVAPIGRALSIDTVAAGLLPKGKVDWLSDRGREGHRVLMVGDGLNDAPALGAAHVSMAPASAADIGRKAADLVFLHDDLAAVPRAHAIARQADRLIRENFALAVAYNLLAVPVAILGEATPLIAALAMSVSSLTVVGNALRLGAGRNR